MHIDYSTADVAPRERFDYWRDAICDAYLPMACRTPAPQRFEGRIQLERLSALNLSYVSGSARHVQRNAEHIGRDTDACFMLSVQLARRSLVRQSNRAAELSRHDMALYASCEAYEIDCPERVEQLILQIPRAALLARVPHADLLTARRIDARSPIGQLVSGQIQACARAIADQDTVVQSFMQDTLLDLLATALAGLSGRARFELARPERQVLLRAHRLIHERIGDDDLDRQSLAQAMGMPVRSLARVFASDGSSIAACIRETRLTRIAADLADPREAGRSISEIMGRCGLSNFQHASRQFKDRHGRSPSDFRRAAYRSISITPSGSAARD